MKKLIVFIFSFTFLPFLYTQAQNTDQTESISEGANIQLSRILSLEGESEIKEINIDVSEKTTHLEFRVQAIIESGELTIEIMDPKNRKRWDISVGSQASDYADEYVRGNIQKSINEPEAGLWVVKIIPKKVTCEIKIDNIMREG